MSVIEKRKKYVEAFNGFQINMVKPLTNMTFTQLATELGVDYKTLVRIQNKDLWSLVSLNTKTYENCCKFIKQYYLTFPDTQTATLDIPKAKNKQVILSSFQYRAAIHLLYKRRYHLKASDLSFLDTYFQCLENHESLEEYATVTDLLVKLRELFEQKGLVFPDACTVRLSYDEPDPLLTRAELKNVFDHHLHDWKDLELRDVELLEHLIVLYKQGKEERIESESFKIDYRYLISISNFFSITQLRQNIAKLEKLNLLTREFIAMTEGSILRQVYIKLNLHNIASLQHLLPRRCLVVRA